MTTRHLALIVLLAIVGCSDADSFITAQISWLVSHPTDSMIDLSKVGPKGWQRMCFIAPYATNETTKQVIGFEWNSQRHSAIGSDDAIILLVFTSGQRVLAFAEYPRKDGDFIRVSGSCVTPTDARFRKEVDSSGRILLIHQPMKNVPAKQ